MPVFLLPIIAGGYYYYKNKVRGEPLRDEEHQPQTPGAEGCDSNTDLASSSIEVSLVLPSETEEVEAPKITTIMEEVIADKQVLRRKGSTDTAQTEVSMDEQVPVPLDKQIQVEDDTDAGGMLGATCGGCDRGALLEIVECGNNLERNIAVVFSRE